MKTRLKLILTLILGIILGVGAAFLYTEKQAPKPSQVVRQNDSQVTETSNIQTDNLPEIRVSQEKAIQAFKKFYASAKINAIDLKVEHNHYLYEINGFDQVKDCMMQMDAFSGKIIGQSTLRQEYANSEIEALNLTRTISRSTASQTATAKTGTGKAIAWNLAQTSKYDFPVWTVTVAKNNEVAQIKVNAVKNEVIE